MVVIYNRLIRKNLENIDVLALKWMFKAVDISFAGITFR